MMDPSSPILMSSLDHVILITPFSQDIENFSGLYQGSETKEVNQACRIYGLSDLEELAKLTIERLGDKDADARHTLHNKRRGFKTSRRNLAFELQTIAKSGTSKH